VPTLPALGRVGILISETAVSCDPTLSLKNGNDNFGQPASSGLGTMESGRAAIYGRDTADSDNGLQPGR